MGVMLYALVVYQMRARSIRLRTGAPYDDRLGPVSRTWCTCDTADITDCVVCLPLGSRHHKLRPQGGVRVRRSRDQECIPAGCVVNKSTQEARPDNALSLDCPNCCCQLCSSRFATSLLRTRSYASLRCVIYPKSQTACLVPFVQLFMGGLTMHPAQRMGFALDVSQDQSASAGFCVATRNRGSLGSTHNA